MSAINLTRLTQEPKFLAIACDGPHAAQVKINLTDILECPRVFELLERWRSRTDYLICLVRTNSQKPVMAFVADGPYSLRRQATRAIAACHGDRTIWFFGLDAAADAIVRDALRGVSARMWRPSLDDVTVEGNA